MKKQVDREGERELGLREKAIKEKCDRETEEDERKKGTEEGEGV